MSFSFEKYLKSGFVIGEVAQSHDGSLGACFAYAKAVADAGGHAVKFQTHIAEAESTPGEPWRVKFSKQDVTRYEYWQRMEFTPENWKDLKEYVESLGLVFMSSAFSFEAVDLLDELGMEVWKLASGEINNYPLLERIAQTGKPVIISSGMSYWEELDKAVELFKKAEVPYAIMQCTSAYPCPPEEVGLNVIPEMKNRYDCPVGLSDHSGTIYPGLAGAALGMDMLEVHITFDRRQFGPDVPASVTMDEFEHLVKGLSQIKKMVANPIDKDKKASDLQNLRNLFTKSIVTKRPIKSGEIISKGDLCFKKPGTGIPADEVATVIGKKVINNIAANSLLKKSDFE